MRAGVATVERLFYPACSRKGQQSVVHLVDGVLSNSRARKHHSSATSLASRKSIIPYAPYFHHLMVPRQRHGCLIRKYRPPYDSLCQKAGCATGSACPMRPLKEPCFIAASCRNVYTYHQSLEHILLYTPKYIIDKIVHNSPLKLVLKPFFTRIRQGLQNCLDDPHQTF